MPREGYINVSPTVERNDYIKIICAHLARDSKSHAGRLDAVDFALRFTARQLKPIDNDFVREMAQSALANWDFDEEVDPDGAIKRGLEYLASEGDWDQDIIDARLKHWADWDGLEEWAQYLGTEERA